MCELMGMSFARPISAGLTIPAFAPRGEENADGWGFAWYPDQSLALVKEPVKWGSSKYSRFLEEYPSIRSRYYLAHVRHKTTGGEPTHADTHPFARELAGREYCFAHNGTIVGFPCLKLGFYRPVGHTDSEHVFCHLLAQIADWGGRLDEENCWRDLHRLLRNINTMGKLNCLLADSRRLYCYRDINGWKGLAFSKLHLREREGRALEDATVHIDLEGGEVNHGFVVATHPLGNEGWHEFQTGELIVFEDGIVRFSSARARETPEFALREPQPC